MSINRTLFKETKNWAEQHKTLIPTTGRTDNLRADKVKPCLKKSINRPGSGFMVECLPRPAYNLHHSKKGGKKPKTY